VSSKNWLVKDPASTIDYYELFYRRFGGAPATVDWDHPISPIAQPAGRTEADGRTPIPYYVIGDMRTSGDWSIPDGKSIVFFVDGNLTIEGKILLAGSRTGFVAFIVRGDIRVDPSVGRAYGSSFPVVEGVYVTSRTGTFATGKSTTPGSERFVGKGVFIAGSFTLERDLDSVAHNHDTAAELFIYDPAILVTMPDHMRESPIFWQEVAP